MTIVCAGCGDPIAERSLLSALDRYWHIGCLNCSYCGLRLDELGPSVFVRSNMLLCRQDYLKLFGHPGTCAKCRSCIPPDELVMRCQGNVYHVNCFNCAQCQTPLHPGDKVCPINGSLFCEHEFPQLFSSLPKFCLTKVLPRSSDSPVVASRNLPAMPEINGKCTDLTRSPGYHAMMNGQNFGPITHPGMNLAQSEPSISTAAHPLSPAMTMVNNSHSIGDPPPNLNAGSSSTLCDPSFASDPLLSIPTPSLSLEKSSRSSPANSQNSDHPPASRKKQKKVDSRRCPPLRVC